MPAPTVATLPPAPVRGEDRESFATKANTFLDALAGFQTEINALGAYVEDAAAQVEQDRIAAEAVAGQGEGYEEAVVTLGGSFDAGMTIRCVRIGRMVTITGIGGFLTHTATVSGVGEATGGGIPASFLPSVNRVSNVYMRNGLIWHSVAVTSSGGFQLKYQDEAGPAGGISSSGLPPTISYVI